ncbi:TetR/AcrR family transcriptional regulator [Sphingomonas lenta]|nr:TetR/AcrR family transcriptional regulator [Sphingomonas lenta]
MSIRDARRRMAIDRMADHLLEVGMAGASLRSMAAAAGTSDRMLLYYFADKDDLLAVTLEHVAARLTALLDDALPPGVRLPHGELLRAVWATVGSPSLQPYMRLWLELAAGAARSRMPDRAIAGAIMGGFSAWVESHIDTGRDSRPAGPSALLLATVEGLLFLDAIGHRELADLAAENATALASTR